MGEGVALPSLSLRTNCFLQLDVLEGAFEIVQVAICYIEYQLLLYMVCKQ
jgi:hypothetical protein